MYNASATKHQPTIRNVNPLHLFTPGSVQVVMEPPEQRRTGRHFDDAVQAEADQGYGTGDQPGDDGNQTFERCCRRW